MTTKAKARALAKAKMKPKHKQAKILAEKQAIIEEKKKMAEITKEKGVRGLALIAFDHQLNEDEHHLAQSGALGLYREHLKMTPSKTRLSLQPYDDELVEISGVLSDAKFNVAGEMTAIMLANPRVTSAMKNSVFFDSHIWLHFNKLSHVVDETFRLSLGLGCMIDVQGIITSYKSHGNYKYGVDKWAVTNCGISYYNPSIDDKIYIANISQDIANITYPIVEIVNTLDKIHFTSVKEPIYRAIENVLLEDYANMRSKITAGGMKTLKALAEKAEKIKRKQK